MKKYKVLHFPIANSRGGITNYALMNWQYINKDLFQFDFATLSKTLDFEDELRVEGCKVHYLSCYAEENEEKFIEEFLNILDNDYDIIHLHTSYWKSKLVEECAQQRGVPRVIIHAHNTGLWNQQDERIRNELLKNHNQVKHSLSMQDATDFWACSQVAADWLYGQNINQNSIKILNNAIPIDSFIFSKKIRVSYRDNLGFKQDDFILGHVGRFAYEKNHEFLVEVFYHIQKSISNAKLLLIGLGPLKESVMKRVNKLGVQNKVIFLENRNDVHNLLMVLDVFLLPSFFEGFPISLVEAQTSGLKCISSDLVTSEAKLTKNIEFLPLDREIWCNRIFTIAKGYERQDMSREIRKAGFDITNQIKIVERLYMGDDK